MVCRNLNVRINFNITTFGRIFKGIRKNVINHTLHFGTVYCTTKQVDVVWLHKIDFIANQLLVSYHTKRITPSYKCLVYAHQGGVKTEFTLFELSKIEHLSYHTN